MKVQIFLIKKIANLFYIKKLVVLDTIYLPEERLIDKIEQISIAHLLGDAIVRIHEKRPLSPLFSIEKKI